MKPEFATGGQSQPSRVRVSHKGLESSRKLKGGGQSHSKGGRANQVSRVLKIRASLRLGLRCAIGDRL